MRKFKFYKDDLGWFIDLPEWKGEKWELQMVSGADKFLEILSQGKSEIFISLSSEDFPNSNCLRFMEYGKMGGPEMGTGAWYFLTEYKGNEYFLEMWLCDVTKFIFGDFPKVIYFC